MTDSINRWLLFTAMLGVILLFGWKQPLRYRFMSPQQIYAEEHPAPTPAAPAWMAEQQRTLLDRGPYRYWSR